MGDLELPAASVSALTSDAFTEHALLEAQARRWRATVRIVSIMAVLSVPPSLVALSKRGVCTETREDRVRNGAYELVKTVELFRGVEGRLPANVEELASPPSGRGWYDKLPRDAWGRPYLLVAMAEHPRGSIVVSAGADGEFWTGDDVSSWTATVR